MSKMVDLAALIGDAVPKGSKPAEVMDAMLLQAAFASVQANMSEQDFLEHAARFYRSSARVRSS